SSPRTEAGVVPGQVESVPSGGQGVVGAVQVRRTRQRPSSPGTRATSTSRGAVAATSVTTPEPSGPTWRWADVVTTARTTVSPSFPGSEDRTEVVKDSPSRRTPLARSRPTSAWSADSAGDPGSSTSISGPSLTSRNASALPRDARSSASAGDSPAVPSTASPPTDGGGAPDAEGAPSDDDSSDDEGSDDEGSDGDGAVRAVAGWD